MTDIDKYRKGYEETKDKIEESKHDKVSDIPEGFVKGVARLPLTIVEELTRSRDEDRGRDDALHGRDFDPGRKDDDRSGCFITTACLRSKGNADDNCDELRCLRSLRDNYMAQSPEGRQLIDSYYGFAPKVVAAIDPLKDPQATYRAIYDELVQPAVQLTKAGNFGAAVSLYVSVATRLNETYLADQT